MKKGAGPYKKMKDEAKAASGNMRALFSFLGGHVHPITYEDSGIESWKDLRGKRVLLAHLQGHFLARPLV